MRVEKIHLREVGPFDEVEIELPPGTQDDAADVYLLTGPNGSGKSTILYAIAELIAGGWSLVEQRLLGSRLRSLNARAFALCDGKILEAALYQDHGASRSRLESLSGGVTTARIAAGGVGFYGDKPYEVFDYAIRAAQFEVTAPRASQGAFSWAAFAYAGTRTIREVKITAVQEPTTNPFSRSLSFHQTTDSGALANWIANQQFKSLKARANGREDRAVQLMQSIRDIERVVSDILDTELVFDTGDEDNDVRVRLGDRVVAFGVLPDGLASIVSWIADLLMRLDRIPWVDDIPPMQRSFLLLLDEIDIHLHPAWQRKVLPVVQRLFPKAQIIASTHSPFVVASADDAHIVALDVKDGVARLDKVYPSQRGKSYGAILHSIFGITSEFDTDTEALFDRFRSERDRVLADPTVDRGALDAAATELASRGEELRELVRLELVQVERSLRQRAAAP